MDAAFEDAVFKLLLDEISDPVRSAFGLHLIKVDAISASKVPSFDEVSDKMRTQYQNDKAERAFVEGVEIMATLAFENPESLESVADALNLTVNVTDWMSPQATANSGIGRNPAVLAAAFSSDVLQDGFNSEAIERDPSRVIVLRVAELRPSMQQPLAEVRVAIEGLLAEKEARKLAADSGRVLLARLEASEDRQSVASEAELDWSGRSELQRNVTGAEAEIAGSVFRMARPLAGQSVFGGTVIANGDFVIVALEEVIDGSLGAEEQEQREAAKRNLEIEAGRASYDAIVQTLRDNADVVLIRENL
jgi:peptidyl-prolyl cis-trans isomerase D